MPLTNETEFILLACDGLWDKFTNEDAVEFVRKRIQTNVPTQKIVEEIVQEAYNLGSTDNITAILVVFNHTIKNKSMRRAVAAGEAHAHNETNASHSVTQTPSKKKDKTPKKESKGLTKTSVEPPQVIPAKKSGSHSTAKHTAGDKPRTPRGDANEASKPHTDEPSQSNTSDEKKTELASPKSDKSLSKESSAPTDKSPRKSKEDKDKKKHKRDESKASASNSSPAMNVSRGGADVAVTAEDVKRSNSASDSIGNDKA